MNNNKSILIVDDEPDITILTSQVLHLGGFNAITCNDGTEALKIVEEKFDGISLILLDIMMPGRSGFEILKEIKSNKKFDSIKVILFTVKGFQEDIQRGKRLGADAYLTKPFSINHLLDFISKQLNPC
ncbi:MAG: response regulator [Promethearchaeota archaeon]